MVILTIVCNVFSLCLIVFYYISFNRKLKEIHELTSIAKTKEAHLLKAYATNSIREAGVMIIEKDGLILGIARRDNPELFGLIGGKADSHESSRAAAIRETKEECGITVYDCHFVYSRIEIGVKDGVDFFSDCYYATEWEGEPTNLEGLEVRWMTAEELTKTKAAFGSYNLEAFEQLKQQFPELKLK